jgi:hypothetical protein
LLSETGMEVHDVFSVNKTKRLNTSSSSANLHVYMVSHPSSVYHVFPD